MEKSKPLSDRTLKALKPAAKGKTYDRMDTFVPGFGVRVSDTGRCTFILIARFGASKNPTRRALGVYGVLTLAEAREKAAEWIKLNKRGEDPATVEERARIEALRKQENTFLAVAEAFIAEKLPGERKGKEVEQDIRREFIPTWEKRPITEITRRDILEMIKAKRATAPSQARNLLGTLKRLFAWAVDEEYGLIASPADGLKPTKILGEKMSRDRILDEAELFALSRAAKRTKYPYGPVYQLLILTGLRLNEVADARWSEFDLPNRLWIIPAARMKGKNGKAKPHAVPLTDDLMAILKVLQRFKKGDYLFSTTYGEVPVWMTSKVQKRVDKRMLRTLRALPRLARRRGEHDADPAKVEIPCWVNHDIRRTVRSGLSSLKIAEEVREAVLAHVRPGIKGVYDHHPYLDEKREALELWAARMRSIVEPAPANVVPLRAAR